MFRIWGMDNNTAVRAYSVSTSWFVWSSKEGLDKPCAQTPYYRTLYIIIPAWGNPISSRNYSKWGAVSRILQSTNPHFLQDVFFCITYYEVCIHAWDFGDIAACRSSVPNSSMSDIAEPDWPHKHLVNQEFEKYANWNHHISAVVWPGILAFEWESFAWTEGQWSPIKVSVLGDSQNVLSDLIVGT